MIESTYYVLMCMGAWGCRGSASNRDGLHTPSSALGMLIGEMHFKIICNVFTGVVLVIDFILLIFANNHPPLE